jgi:hypothetical protein
MKTAIWNAHYARGWIVGEVYVLGGKPQGVKRNSTNKSVPASYLDAF